MCTMRGPFKTRRTLDFRSESIRNARCLLRICEGGEIAVAYSNCNSEMGKIKKNLKSNSSTGLQCKSKLALSDTPKNKNHFLQQTGGPFICSYEMKSLGFQYCTCVSFRSPLRWDRWYLGACFWLGLSAVCGVNNARVAVMGEAVLV